MEHYQFNMHEIAAYLKNDSTDLNNLYDWHCGKNALDELLQEKLITETQRSELHNAQAIEQHRMLCEILAPKLKNMDTEKFDRTVLWIIKKWGRIPSRKGDDNTIEIVKRFLTDKTQFDRIASVSKIAAFEQPDKYIIYDSRVALAINWIIYKTNAGNHYFPNPKSKNAELTKKINIIIRKGNIIPKAQAYSELNKLIVAISAVLWKDKYSQTPFYTQQLLFSLKEKILEEMTELKIQKA